MATAESPGGSGDRTGLPTTVRCAWIDDRSIRRCPQSTRAQGLNGGNILGTHDLIAADSKGSGEPWGGLLGDM